jgi:sulfoxide reductase heme-binding subunit YedZ
MNGKNWQRLHRLVYVAGAFAVVHYWWLVKSGVLTPWKVTAILTVLLLARAAYSLYKRVNKQKPILQTTKS